MSSKISFAYPMQYVSKVKSSFKNLLMTMNCLLPHLIIDILSLILFSKRMIFASHQCRDRLSFMKKGVCEFTGCNSQNVPGALHSPFKPIHFQTTLRSLPYTALVVKFANFVTLPQYLSLKAKSFSKLCDIHIRKNVLLLSG